MAAILSRSQCISQMIVSALLWYEAFHHNIAVNLVVSNIYEPIEYAVFGSDIG